MHALVTGGGGFLGRAIIDQLLARGDAVRCLARGDYPELARLGVETVRGDIRDPAAASQAARGVDCVFHTAAIAGVGGRWKTYHDVNVEGTRHVIDACREAGVGTLVHTSSPSIVFAGVDQCGVDEQTPYALEWLRRYRCYYSYSKALAEVEVLAANDDSLQTCALRPHLIWGPGDRHLIPRLLDRARHGRLRRVGAGTNLVDITYIDNAAAAHLAAADRLATGAGAAAPGSSPAGRAYFLSQGAPVNCWQWIDQVLGLASLPPVRRSISADTAWRLGTVLEQIYRCLPGSREPPMTRFVAAQLSHSHWYDITAAKTDLGYAPRVSTKEGMERLGQDLEG